MSAHTEKKAQKLVDDNGVARIDDHTYQVKASKEGQFYIVENGVCECLGFRFRKTCTHIIAIKILQEQTTT